MAGGGRFQDHSFAIFVIRRSENERRLRNIWRQGGGVARFSPAAALSRRLASNPNLDPESGVQRSSSFNDKIDDRGFRFKLRKSRVDFWNVRKSQGIQFSDILNAFISRLIRVAEHARSSLWLVIGWNVQPRALIGQDKIYNADAREFETTGWEGFVHIRDKLKLRL